MYQQPIPQKYGGDSSSQDQESDDNKEGDNDLSFESDELNNSYSQVLDQSPETFFSLTLILSKKHSLFFSKEKIFFNLPFLLKEKVSRNLPLDSDDNNYSFFLNENGFIQNHVRYKQEEEMYQIIGKKSSEE